MVQVKNEYGSFGSDTEYQQSARTCQPGTQTPYPRRRPLSQRSFPAAPGQRPLAETGDEWQAGKVYLNLECQTQPPGFNALPI
jgi:hypothetical protein